MFPDVAERPIFTLLSRFAILWQFAIWWDQISDRLRVLSISNVSSPRHYRKFQTVRRCFWCTPLMSMGQTAGNACSRFKTVGEARCNARRSSPVGVCVNSGEHGKYRSISYCALAVMVNGPQVEEEARYEPIRSIEVRESIANKSTLTPTPNPILHY